MTNISENKLGRKVLGRGLGALLPDRNNSEDYFKSNVIQKKSGYFFCKIEDIEINKKQPRKEFNTENIEELSKSIKENGILQALLVRAKSNGKYELVAGERRLRAAKSIGFTEVPVVVKELSDRQTLQVALIENIQREDLNIIEEAEAYKSLMEEYGMTQKELSESVGKNRSSIANYLRILTLPADIKESLLNKDLSMGHARAICGISDILIQREVFKKIKENNFSVRQTETLIQGLSESTTPTNKVNKKRKTLSPIEKNLRDVLKTKVKINGTDKKGKFLIDYYSKTDFDRILSLLYGEHDA